MIGKHGRTIGTIQADAKRPTTPHAGSPSAGTLTCPGCGARAALDAVNCAYCERALATVACGNCFARLHEGMEFCPSCGGRNTRHEQGVPTVMACPGCAANRCTSSLLSVNVGTHAMHECLACHGLWLDAPTMATLERDANARSTFTVAPTEPLAASRKSHSMVRGNVSPIRYRRCPICADMMSRVNVARISGVIVDRCQEHGTYFDIDELQQLVQFLENGGVDRARTREREALADERRHLQFMKELEQKQTRFEASPRSEAPSFTANALLVALAHKILDD